MILEIIVISAIVFVVMVLFYKQRRPDLQILQMEADQMQEQLTDLLEEEQPLVIRGVPPPRGLTREGLQKIPRLAEFSVGGQPLSSVLGQPAMLAGAAGMPTLSQENRELFATELALPIWAQRNWFAHLSQTAWLGSTLGTLQTEAILGGLGLFRTCAYTTLLFPTEGTYLVTILSRESEEYLPPGWNYRYAHSFTPNDTPLVADIQYLDIVLRPGSVLCIPKHTIISLEPKDPAAFAACAVVEFHMPVSVLAKSFSQN